MLLKCLFLYDKRHKAFNWIYIVQNVIVLKSFKFSNPKWRSKIRIWFDCERNKIHQIAQNKTIPNRSVHRLKQKKNSTPNLAIYAEIQMINMGYWETGKSERKKKQKSHNQTDKRIYLRNISNISKLRLNHSDDYVIFSADLKLFHFYIGIDRNGFCVVCLFICQHGPQW